MSSLFQKLSFSANCNTRASRVPFTTPKLLALDLTPVELPVSYHPTWKVALIECRMLSRYIREAMSRARYRILEDGSYFGEVPGLEGVWANARSLERCRAELQEVVEEWLLLKLRDNDPIPKLGRCDLRLAAA